MELYLPRAGGELGAGAEGPAASVVEDAQAGRRGTVLVVDDQDEVRDVVLAHLEALGYRTVPAANGRLALDLLSESGGGIDALLVDHAMPGLSGLEVIRAAREARRSLPVVLMTGYVDTDALGKRVDGVVLLKKPFRRQELAAALDAAPQLTAAAAAGGKR
ncbi:MAG TPA: response regulator [Stellaceae bacterium]